MEAALFLCPRGPKGQKLSDRNDGFYQPWLREAPPAPVPAPAKRRTDSAPDAGLARDEVPPLEIGRAHV